MGSGAVTSTASVLFTDLVGSTELLSRLGDDLADEVRHRHDDAVRGAVEANNGRIVKSLGDGVMAVFESSADAVAAAVDAQQRVTALADLPEPITIRVGASAGDVSKEGDDYFGTTVNEAARLCDVAQGGQILVADLVRALARGRGGFGFESFGSLDLKGLPDPVPTCSVGWEPLSPVADDAIPFPPALLPATGGPYVGRPDIRLALSELWDETKVDGARMGLLVGEPGIGKTRTAYEIAKEARESGAAVLFGRCDDELRVPYQPFVEALDWQISHAPDLPLGRLPGELTRLVPDLATMQPDLPSPVASDPRTEEHRLFEAVASWAVDMAESRGLVLVLDDIHWATKPTLLMMMHVIRHAADVTDARLLIVATYRDTDVDRTHPLSSVLGDLQRIEGVRRIPVDPLDVDEVIDLVEQAAGHELDEVTRGVATRAHAETDGNPFFVAEVLRHLIESGSVRFVDGRWIVPDPEQIDVPEGVRDVVGQRLSRLSDTANDVLRAAAVVGREFDLDLIGEVVGVNEDPLLDAVDEAMRARLIEETEADRFRFAHALVRTSLYEELSASRQRRMHRRITEFYAKSRPDDLAALAHHAVEAGPTGGDLSDAIGYVLAAADRARETRALGEAEGLYRKALELLEEDEALELDHRALVARCGIGEVQRDQGDPAFRETLLAVSDDAVRAGDERLVVRAALANTRGFVSIIGDVDHERIGHLEEALRRTPDADTEERARLEALLAAELMFDFDRRDERLALVDRAVNRAEEVGDDLTVAYVLGMTRMPDLVPERWTTGLDRSRRAVEAADRCGDPNLRVANRINMIWDLLSRGDLDEARRVADDHLAIAAETAPMTTWLSRAQAAHLPMYYGDLDGTAAENDAAFELGLELGAVDAMSWWAAVAALLGWFRDRTIGDPDLIGELADTFPGTPTWRCSHAVALGLADRTDECRQVVRAHRLDQVDSFPRDVFWHNLSFTLGQTADHLGDADLAHDLLRAFEPYSENFVHFCIGFNGPVRQSLAIARAVTGDFDGAVEDVQWSLDWARQRGLVVPAVTYEIDLADLLLRRGGPNDLSRARRLIDHGSTEAERLGMPGWIARGEELLRRAS